MTFESLLCKNYIHKLLKVNMFSTHWSSEQEYEQDHDGQTVPRQPKRWFSSRQVCPSCRSIGCSLHELKVEVRGLLLGEAGEEKQHRYYILLHINHAYLSYEIKPYIIQGQVNVEKKSTTVNSW